MDLVAVLLRLGGGVEAAGLLTQLVIQRLAQAEQGLCPSTEAAGPPHHSQWELLQNTAISEALSDPSFKPWTIRSRADRRGRYFVFPFR